MAGSSFQFRLERVRALRERRKDLARQELALAIGRLSDSEERLQNVEQRLEQARADQRSGAGALTGSELQGRQAFLEQVERQRTAGLHDLKRSQGEVADRGAALSVAAQEQETLERLKERQRLAHAAEMLRREGQALDEIALDRHRRRVA